MKKAVGRFESHIADPKLKEMFHNCFYNTLDTTVKILEDGSAYILTGDISVMWLRDSSEQVMQYVRFADVDEDVRTLIRALLKRQMFYIQCDPYANSFNQEPNNEGFVGDECEKSPWVWERKFEIDSLCYPIYLSYRYWKQSGDASIFNDEYQKSVRLILQVFHTEQHHVEKSSYFHYRPNQDPSFSVPNRGHGAVCNYTGMVWSAYRPSDDPCVYGYFVPGNMMIRVILRQLSEIYATVIHDEETLTDIRELDGQIAGGIEKYGIAESAQFGKIYAYEADGFGNQFLMDDANVPSLLSLPYLGYCGADDPVYQNTRKFVLSNSNPYYFEGRVIKGIGSPHTSRNQVWPIALIIQCLTSDDPNEINSLLHMLVTSEAGTGYIHESINKDDSENYTRSWFAWANSLFSSFILEKAALISDIQE